MKRRLLFLLSFLSAVLFATARGEGFEGLWRGEIAAPNTRAEFGLAFTLTEKGLLVSVYFPKMFLYGVNFGPADIHGDTFSLEPLNLTLVRHDDVLSGTFALARLPVELRRGGSFTPELPAPAFPAAPTAVWSRALGAPAWASPVARDGVIYVGTTDGVFHAVRAEKGEEAWTWRGPHPLYGEALVTEDSVYFLDERCDLICLARVDGALKWRTPLYDEKLAGGPAPTNETFNHRAASPVIDVKNVIYVGSTDNGVYAIKARTGKILWRYDAKSRVYAPVTLQNDTLIIGGYDGTILTLNRRTHQLISHLKLGGPVVSAPVVAGDRIVVGCRDYQLYGLDGAATKTVWRNSFWFSWVESTPRIVDGTMYIGGSDYRRVSALNPADGSERWATDVRGLTWGSPVVTADTVFAGTAGQTMAGTVIRHTGGMVALDRGTGSVRWRYVSPVPDGASFTGFVGSLVFVDGKIVGASVDGTLLALPANAPAG